MNITAEPLINAPLWDRTRASFARALAAFGGAACIAAIASLTEALRRDIVRRLCPLENIVRKLLLAEAAELRRCESLEESFRGAAQRRTRNPGVTSAMSAPGFRTALTRVRNDTDCAAQAATCTARAACSDIDNSRPETWSARFSLSLPRDPHRVPNARAPRIRSLWGPTPAPPEPPPPPARKPDANLSPAFRLARRFEALRRVLENPLPHARRLARLLARVVRRFPELPMRLAMAPARAAGYDPSDPRLGIEATGCALDAGFALRDTS